MLSFDTNNQLVQSNGGKCDHKQREICNYPVGGLHVVKTGNTVCVRLVLTISGKYQQFIRLFILSIFIKLITVLCEHALYIALRVVLFTPSTPDWLIRCRRHFSFATTSEKCYFITEKKGEFGISGQLVGSFLYVSRTCLHLYEYFMSPYHRILTSNISNWNGLSFDNNEKSNVPASHPG